MEQMEKITMSVQEAAETLGIGRAKAYEAVHTGEIPSVRIGSRIIVPVAALQKMLDVAAPRELKKAEDE
jgi:excisionase family DNA binding protein